MFRYDTHVHTSEASGCANSTAAEMVQKYKDEGYTGIMITDHFFNGNSAIPRDLPWDEMIDLYCLGYEHAKEKGDEIGLQVFFGVEFTYNGSDFLVYGLDKEWLKANQQIMSMELTRFIELCHASGGKVIHAHPFRDYDYIRSMTLCPHYIDGVEIINTSHSDPVFNERAKLYAEWYDLPVTCGSDSHNTTNRWYRGGVMTEKKFNSALDYAEAVINRKITIIE